MLLTVVAGSGSVPAHALARSWRTQTVGANSDTEDSRDKRDNWSQSMLWLWYISKWWLKARAEKELQRNS